MEFSFPISRPEEGKGREHHTTPDKGEGGLPDRASCPSCFPGRLKRRGRSMYGGIRTTRCREEEDGQNAENGQNTRFPSDAAKDH